MNNNKEKKCAYCGKKPHLFYPLCLECLELKNEGLLIKNEKTGKWEKVTNKKTNTNIKETAKKESNKCIICGEDAGNKPLCLQCYKEAKEYKDTFDLNSTWEEFSNYYYNLKNSIWRIQDITKVQNNCKKLFQLAELSQNIHDIPTLRTKVEDDIKSIIESKNKRKEKIVINETTHKEDSKQEQIITTNDGHKVKSQGEKIVDDILYNLRYPHAYSPAVTEIDTKVDRAIEADWFIPVKSNTTGIYIEYWGMESKRYLENKKEKKELYKKYNLPLIEIEKEEYKEARLETRLQQEILEKARTFYDVHNFRFN